MNGASNTSDFSNNLVDLIINQDEIAQGWIKHLISIEAALAVGLGFVLKIGGEHPGILEARFLPWALSLIPMFGIAAAAILCIIIVRERKSQAAYIVKFNALIGGTPQPAGDSFSIFPKNSEIKSMRFGYISRRIMLFVVLVGIFWAIVFVGLLIAIQNV
jgi:hypothetical protein